MQREKEIAEGESLNSREEASHRLMKMLILYLGGLSWIYIHACREAYFRNLRFDVVDVDFERIEVANAIMSACRIFAEARTDKARNLPSQRHRQLTIN